ncbi:MAG: hypothetical protein JWP61_2564 [Friedmanniella sp.]|nr:hypothetical protein [Friedmanniella sp.]
MSAWLRRDPLRALLTVLGAVTALTGAVQVVAPGLVLGALGVDRTPVTRQLFGTVGMFMVVVGGLLTHVLLRPDPSRVVVGWAGGQKLGAFLAVCLGVLAGVFAPVALGVAFFDLATAVGLAVYARRLGHPVPAAPVAVVP